MDADGWIEEKGEDAAPAGPDVRDAAAAPAATATTDAAVAATVAISAPPPADGSV